jgi:hypothetical protein
MRRPRRLLALVALAGCQALSLGSQARRIVAASVDRPAAALAPCLPDPALVDRADELELLVYRWTPIQGTSPPVAIVRGRGAGTSAETRRVATEVPEFMAGGRLPEYHEFCQVTLAIGGGRVRALEVLGRDGSGLRADARCAMRLRECAEAPP